MTVNRNPEGQCVDGINTSCCQVPVPRTLTATITNVASCNCGDGETITLTYHEINHYWMGSKTICGINWECTLSCGTDHWTFNSGCGQPFPAISDSFECSPFVATFNDVNMSACCGSINERVNILVTE